MVDSVVQTPTLLVGGLAGSMVYGRTPLTGGKGVLVETGGDVSVGMGGGESVGMGVSDVGDAGTITGWRTSVAAVGGEADGSAIGVAVGEMAVVVGVVFMSVGVASGVSVAGKRISVAVTVAEVSVSGIGGVAEDST